MSLETRKFDAEVGKVLNLMIHSLYTNKEIFIRELISNASDACDKLRYLSLSDSGLIKDDPEFNISIKVDKDKREVVISDNGIGMNKEDLIQNLGTIAKSGTASFLEQITGDAKKDASLIGQFGVGFYSVYMVADKVSVISRKAGEGQGYKWISDGAGEYSIQDCNKELRGTEITIHLKEDEDDYLDHFRLKHIIKTYSDHISIPIYFEQEGAKNQINSSSALWTKNKSEISEEQYKDFYKNVAYAGDDPWVILHNKNEGAVEFTNLIFIPTNKTFDLFHPDRKRRIKLYIRRVFVTDENIDLVPRYMRFLRGVVDCDSLPLNISRQTLQHNAVVDKIRNNIINRVLGELAKKKDSDRKGFEEFWANFGSAMKEGLCEPIPESEKLLDICIFYSYSQNKMITLAEYIENFTANQKEIYYISGDNLDKLKSSPQLEGFKKKNIDVLLLTDMVDDFWVNIVHKYKEFEIKSVTRSNIDLTQYNSAEEKIDDTNHEKLVSYFKNVLGDLVKDVKISKKLESVPACLSVDEGNLDIRMERFLVEQKQLQSASAKILEINPSHRLVNKIQATLTSQQDGNDDTSDLAKLIYEQACIVENEPIPDSLEFCRRLNKFINVV